MSNIRRTWLPFLNEDVPQTCDTPEKVAAYELKLGCAALGIGSPKLAVEPSMGEGYAIEGDTIAGGSVGILYGVYAFLSAKAAGEPVPEGTQSPFWRLRMLNSWDNADGSVERGYSGRSLWFEGGELRWDGPRIRQLGRMLASAGINVLCVNNVNVRSDAARLIEDRLPDLARLADAAALALSYASPNHSMKYQSTPLLKICVTSDTLFVTPASRAEIEEVRST